MAATPDDSITFTFPDTPPVALGSTKEVSITDIAAMTKTFGRKDTVLITESTSGRIIVPAFGNGLLGTIYKAYSQHIPLVLRPDDLFISILVSFGVFVAGNAEALRSVFVSHSGIKELEVHTDDITTADAFSDATPAEWNLFISRMAETVDRNIKGDIVEWTKPGFSTTTQVDKTAANVALLAAVREYFGMKLLLGCGLSEVTLEGTVSDWVALREKVTFLETFPSDTINKWASLLGPVLDQFVSARRGDPVLPDFWQRIVTATRRGSGSQKVFRGWFLVFAPFAKDGRYILFDKKRVDLNHVYAKVDDDDIPVCGITVSVKSSSCRNITRRQTFLLTAGVLATGINGTRIRPAVGWALALKHEITQQDIYEHGAQLAQKYYHIDITGSNYDRIVSGAMSVAHSHKVPNDKLFDLIEACIAGHANKKVPGTPDRDSAVDILEWIQNDHSQGCLHKYIPETSLDTPFPQTAVCGPIPE